MRPAVQDFDQRLRLELRSNDVAGLRYDYQPIGLSDLGGLLARPRQVLCKRGQHGSRHY